MSEGADTNVQKSKRFGIPDRLKREIDLESLSKGSSAVSPHVVVVETVKATTCMSVAEIASGSKVSVGTGTFVRK